MLERIQSESVGLRSPGFADIFERGEPLQRLEPTCEVVGFNESGEMLSKLLVACVIEALDRSFLDGSVHSLNLAVGPRMLRFGQPMIDIASRAGDIWQLADAMTLEATMQRGSCQMRDGRLQRIEAIIERQERMPPEGDNDRLVPD